MSHTNVLLAGAIFLGICGAVEKVAEAAEPTASQAPLKMRLE
jgi:hypothetical protein